MFLLLKLQYQKCKIPLKKSLKIIVTIINQAIAIFFLDNLLEINLFVP